jgi:pimeloyl-ACP methyl ester carboxylesterase
MALTCLTARPDTCAWGDPASGSSFASRDGTILWYADTGGSGEPLVFLHGFSGSSAAAGHFAARASDAGLRFIAADLRGHGLSGKPPIDEAYVFDRFVEDAEALLDEAGVERAHLVGHCLGGMVATACASAIPDRVASLALVGTSLRPSVDQRLAPWAGSAPLGGVRALARRLFPARADVPAHVDYGAFRNMGDRYWRRMLADVRALSADTALAILEDLKRLDLSEAARSIDTPTLVVHGARDSVFPHACAERTCATLRDARLLILPDDNHVSVVLDADSALFGDVIDFVSDAASRIRLADAECASVRASA